MTEAEWLKCEDVSPMLKFLRYRGSNRKLRLFAVASCRSIWQLLPNEAARTLVRVAEGFADGTATEDQLAVAEGAFAFAETEPGYAHDSYSASVAIGAVEQLGRESDETYARRTKRVVPDWPEQAYEAASGAAHGAFHATSGQRRQEQKVRLVALIRDIFGSPFHTIRFDPEWLTRTVIARAAQMYECRDFSAMPILADALQDGGCDNEDVLNHCRGPGPHVRGCWVIDLILGKE